MSAPPSIYHLLPGVEYSQVDSARMPDVDVLPVTTSSAESMGKSGLRLLVTYQSNPDMLHYAVYSILHVPGMKFSALRRS